ncbi:sulfur carrier protein ThiS [Photobacterium sp. DNB23_23_1]|uniref:Sulfur carrier protein ThiS n=1 Tax=Photobacterium pectinilyticum TaxID=2906793 RepID=A0ABT1N7F1_9GAMM|nr:sulfur carrier protein ThiS [Photobacterium sp. ZSDE20]MCQ1060683.1 sulfur carrier protein ThiS [Photobacterium sp. ZSDE20]MDD1828292.1 sulfur carrier protein ThiS [Photobacterium sp. ZSDE20]
MTTATLIQVRVNDKPVEVPEGQSLGALLIQLEMPLQATAVALNEDIVARSEWDVTVLSTGDRIALFQAIAGG